MKKRRISVKISMQEKGSFYFFILDKNKKIISADRNALKLWGKKIIGGKMGRMKCPLCALPLSREEKAEGHWKIQISEFDMGSGKYIAMLENISKKGGGKGKTPDEIFSILSKITGGISHDINSTLSAINSALFILRHKPCYEEIRNEAEIIEKSARNLSLITQNFIVFSQRKILDFLPESFYTVLKGAAEKSGIKLKAKCHKSRKVPYISCDKDSIIEAFATIFEEMTFISKTDKIRAECINISPRRLFFMITAKNFNLSPDEADSFFNPYKKLTGKRSKYGLSSAYGTIKMHGGNISIKPSHGKNSAKIIFDFPIFSLK